MTINSNNKLSFKTWIREHKDSFTENIIVDYMGLITPMLTLSASGVTDNPSKRVKVLVFDYNETIDITHRIYDEDWIYLPGTSNDKVTLKYGNDTHDFTFDINGNLQKSLNDTITLGSKQFTVLGLGGGLLGGGNAPPPPPPATYTVGQNATTVNEGGVVNITVATTNVADGTTLYYTLSGTATADDFVGGTMAGSFTVSSNSGDFNVNVVGDIITDDGETFTASIRTDSTSGTIVGTSSQVTITDVSQSEAISQTATTVDEGGTVVFTLSTAGYPTGHTFYWTTEITAGGITASDFNDGSLSGTITTNSVGQADINRTLVSDRITEGVEKFKIQIRTGSTGGPIILTSNEVAINDTSVSIGANANGKTFGPVNVNRDGGGTNATSDWYTICGMDNLPDGSKVALFIDTSGSMTMSTIQASYDLLLSKLNARAITIISVTNSNEDWITPFLTDLA